MYKINDPSLPLQENPATGALLVLTLTTLMTSLAISSINILLPALITAFDATFSQIQWVMIGYMLLLTSTLVFAGQLSDMLGRKRLFLIGLIIFTLSAGACGFSNTLLPLLFFRAIQGIGGAILITVSMALVSDIYAKNKLSSAIGLMGSASAIGTGLGPIWGGFIADTFSWQGIFSIHFPIGAILYLLAIKCLPADKPTENAIVVFDYKCAFIFLLFILSYTFSIKLTGKYFDLKNILLLLCSLLFLFTFLSLERHSSAPLIPLYILKNREIVTSLVSNFIVSSVVIASLVTGPFYLMIALELNTTQAGIAMAASPLSVAFVSSIISKLSSQYTLKKFILVGLLVITFGAVCMTQLKATHGLAGYLLCLMTMAIGYATFLSTNNTLTMINASTKTRGIVSGILNLSRNLGLLTGTAVMSGVFNYFSPITALASVNTMELELGLHAVYQLAVALLVIAITLQISSIFKSHQNGGK